MSMNMTKSEFYQKFISIQKETGQGLSGIVKIQSNECANYLNELIEEGLAISCDTGGSIGHPESNIFYLPTKGYNVWNDENGRYLTFVRIYLGIVSLEYLGPLEPGLKNYLQNPEFMKQYSDWLSKNEQSLRVMQNLDETYYGVNNGLQFNSDGLSNGDIEWITSRKWYTDNNTILKCLNDSINSLNLQEEEIKVSEKLILLYKTDKKYSKEMDELSSVMKDVKKQILIRKRVNDWLSSQNKRKKIQSLLISSLMVHH